MKKLSVIPLSGLTIVSMSSQAVIAQEQQKPNVVLIVVDDMGWKDLGVYGSDYHQTPQIDNFAKDGVRF